MTTVSRPAGATDVVALQYALPTRMVTIPLGILGAVVVVMVSVTAAIVGGGGHVQDLAYNGAVVWSLVGYIVAVGVQNVSVTFPLALALGTTRRTFALGTLASAFAESVLLAAACLLLLGVELISGGWFIGARVLSDPTLGSGNPLQLVVEVLLGTLTALSVGGLYGAAFVRFGARGPGALGLATALLVVVALLVLLAPITAAAQALGAWSLVLVAVVLIVGSTVGEHLLLRRASVR